jgi:hypothetical protein
MSISTRIIRYVPLALAVAAVAAPGAQASGSESGEAAFRAAHWKHEDSMYETNRAASVPSLPTSLEAHWNHEDAQYKGRTVSSSQPKSGVPTVEAAEGSYRLAVLTAAGGMVALLIVGTAAVTGIRRRNRPLAPS